MDLSLKDKVCVITGPAKGMGAEVTRAFAREGCRLALLGRDIAAVEPRGRRELKQAGVAVVVHRCDVTDADQCETAIRRC